MRPAADGGGPFGRTNPEPRNWMRASAPGIAFRCHPAESYPVGSGAPRPRERRRALSWVAAASLGLGLWFTGGGAYLYTKTALAQWLLHHAWGETQATGAPVKPWPWADTYPIARLLAPAHDVDLVVLAGAANPMLVFGPGYHEGSALPGQPGDTVVSAPRDTHFRFLRHLAAGDELIVEIATGQRIHYRVNGPMIEAVEALRQPRLAAPTLTLVAGDPPGPLDMPRYIVVATADGAKT